MKDSIRLGRIFGIPVGLHWGALVVAALFTFSLATTGLADFAPATSLSVRLAVGIGGVTVFFASILAHEFGHALVALRHGVGVSGITLWLMGGMAKLDRQAPSARSEFQIAIAGPAVSLALGFFFASSAVILAEIAPNRLAVAVVAWLAAVNLILAVFNLLPAAPLDGGRVLTAVLWRHWDDPNRARLIAGRCGLVLGVLLVAAGLYLSVYVFGAPGLLNVAVGAMIFFAAREEIRSAVLTRRLATTTVEAVHSPHPHPVAADLSVAQLRSWAGAGGETTAFPVLRWDHAPIGYVAPYQSVDLDLPTQSWTKVHQVMHRGDDVRQIPLSASIDLLMDTWTARPANLAITSDSSGRPVGTITEQQIRPLLLAPTLWGNDREPLPLRRPSAPANSHPSTAVEVLDEADFSREAPIPTSPPIG